MKIIFKRIIAVILCSIIAIASARTSTAYAAKKLPLKASFNGKSVTLSKDVSGAPDIKLKTLKKKLGNPKKKKNDGVTTYTWKKGKTSVEYWSNSDYDGITVDINDKNGSILGVKTGMKKDTALKNLKKATRLEESTEGIYVYDEPHNSQFDEIIAIPISIACKVYLKNGKVTSIYYQSSL